VSPSGLGQARQAWSISPQGRSKTRWPHGRERNITMRTKPLVWLAVVTLGLSGSALWSSGCDSSRDHAGNVNVGGSGEGTGAETAKSPTPEGGGQGGSGTSWDASRLNSGSNRDRADVSGSAPSGSATLTKQPPTRIPDLAADSAADTAQSSSGRSVPNAAQAGSDQSAVHGGGDSATGQSGGHQKTP
jgi:hypothetical protein